MGAGAAWIALAGTPGCGPTDHRANRAPARPRKTPSTTASPARPASSAWGFRSRPDLHPPTVDVTTQAHDTAPGYIFITPKKGPGQDGPMIVDDSGQPVWFQPLQGNDEFATDFRVQSYRGRPVLTWWEGKLVYRYGVGEYVILDSSYQEVARVQAGNGYHGDLHEFLITPHDTALLTVYNRVHADLSAFGGPKDGVVLDGVFQEVDIGTGEVLLEWHSLDHVGLDESYSRPSEDLKRPFDYFHINSIAVDHDDNLLIDAKRTCTVYKVDRKTGEIIWRLGGKKSTFEMGAGTRVVYQHDARRTAPSRSSTTTPGR